MFKFKITRDEFDGLDDSQKSMYAEAGEGYQLAIDGLPDVSGLEKKVNELLGEKKSEQEKRRQAEDEAKRVAEEQARKKGDIEALEKSWQDKLDARERELLGQVKEKDDRLHTLLVDNVAQSVATSLAGDCAAILIPHIKARLIVEDGKTRVIDAEGNPSASTLEDLEKEFKHNKLFASVVIGSKASGPGGKGGLTIARGEGKKWNDYTEAERIQLFNEDREEFNRLAATQNQ